MISSSLHGLPPHVLERLDASLKGELGDAAIPFVGGAHVLRLFVERAPDGLLLVFEASNLAGEIVAGREWAISPMAAFMLIARANVTRALAAIPRRASVLFPRILN